MSLIKKDITHFEAEHNDHVMHGTRTVTKLFGISLKSAFNATIRKKGDEKPLIEITHTTNVLHDTFHELALHSFKSGGFYNDEKEGPSFIVAGR